MGIPLKGIIKGVNAMLEVFLETTASGGQALDGQDSEMNINGLFI